ncbi:MAG: hypothetical protein H6Q53_1681 [Deltaproteobacteria bacterium]|nr:hypothetical protein [Deltaproteobacteria bacterium]
MTVCYILFDGRRLHHLTIRYDLIKPLLLPELLISNLSILCYITKLVVACWYLTTSVFGNSIFYDIRQVMMNEQEKKGTIL